MKTIPGRPAPQRSDVTAFPNRPRARDSARRCRPLLEALEDRLVPSPVIQTFLANGPNPVGTSPGYTGAPPADPPGFGARAIAALEAGGVPPPASGDPAQTPSAFVAGLSFTRVTFEQLVTSSFPSWQAHANPGATFGPAFAQELGNAEYFLVHVREENPGVNTFRLADLAVELTGSNPQATAFGAAVSHPAGNWAGDLNTTDRIGFLADGTQVSGPGTATTLLHDLFFVGFPLAVDATPFAGTEQGRLDQAVAELRGLEDSPGTGFTLEAKYSLLAPSAPSTGLASLRVNTPTADLELTQTAAPDPVLAGQELTYTLTVVNRGPFPATQVMLLDSVPENRTSVSFGLSQGTGMLSRGGFTLVAFLGTVASGASATVTLSVTPSGDARSLTNSATVRADETDPDFGNNSSQKTVTALPAADLALTQASGPDPVQADQVVTYSLTVVNAGPSTATGVTLTDALPAGAALVSATPSQGTATSSGGTVTVSLGDVASGASAGATLVVRAPMEPGPITNTATVTAAETDTRPANNSAAQTTTVSAAVDLVVTQARTPDEVLARQSHTYTITVANRGPSTATGVSLTDSLAFDEAVLSAAASQGTATVSDTTVTADLGTLAPGASATVTVVAAAPSDAFEGNRFANSATAAANETDTNPADNTGTVLVTVVPVVNLVVRKSAASDALTAGQAATFFVTVANFGPSTATGVTVTDTDSFGTSFSRSLGSLPSGASAGFAFQEMTAGPGTLTNTATATADQKEGDPADNTASVTVTVSAAPAAASGPSADPTRQFVNEAFAELLGRDASPAEAEGFESLLDQGALTRQQVVQIVEGSLEYRTQVVQQLDQRYLGRAADPGGLSAFVNFLGQGGTIDQATAIILSSDEYFARHGGTNAGFITGVYQDVLGRAPSAAELPSWLQVLAGGGSRLQVAGATLGSPEAQTAEVQALYQQFLGRPADASGLSFFVGALQSGASREQVNAILLASQEFYARVNGLLHQRWVAQVYRDVLHREVDPAGLAWWTGLLNQGAATPSQVALVIASSPEAEAVYAAGLYVTFLGRPADPSGLGAAVNFLTQGGTREQLAALLAGSDEFLRTRGGGTDDGFLNALYREALGRAADPAAQALFGQALRSGAATRAEVAAVVFGSAEYRHDLVVQLYQQFLGRTPEPAALAAGGRDEQLTAALLGSPEYFARL